MEKNAVVYVAGRDTLIGKALSRVLRAGGLQRLLPDEPNLHDAAAVDAFFREHRPAYVFVAAGPSGGILANQRRPAELMFGNLLVGCHVIDAAHRYGTKKLLYLASSCCYPRQCPQPMRPEALFSGPLEPTSSAYATAKLAGLMLCQAYRRQYGDVFIAGIPADVYGPGSGWSAEDSHVVPALLRKMHDARLVGASHVEIWGSGEPRREFLFVDDLARAAVKVVRCYEESEPINLGGGVELSVRDVALKIQAVVGYQGELRFNRDRPDGMPRKVLDSRVLASLGWAAQTSIDAGLQATYRSFQRSQTASPAPLCS